MDNYFGHTVDNMSVKSKPKLKNKHDYGLAITIIVVHLLINCQIPSLSAFIFWMFGGFYFQCDCVMCLSLLVYYHNCIDPIDCTFGCSGYITFFFV